MNILFVHNNFPAQFRHLAQHLASDPQNCVAAIGAGGASDLAHVILKRYNLNSVDLSQTHPFARRFDLECRRAEQVLYAANELNARGFRPDVIVVHSGWGENIPLRAVFPRARLIVYCEYYYRMQGQDVDFDAEFPVMSLDSRTALHLKNAAQLLGLVDADAGLAPTQWQRATYPKELQDKIAVIHEGIDTTRLCPDPNATFDVPSGLTLRAGQEIVTFVARDLEPLRGYHIFLRALPEILRARPAAQILIVGGDGVSYGLPPPPGTTWKAHYLREVEGALDMMRVHFLGRVTYDRFVSLLQVSAAHVYFTYPFVLSWSCLEAMSAGCLVFASDVAPVREFLDDACGVPLPFHAHADLAARVVAALADPDAFRPRRDAARQRILERLDLTTIALPALQSLLRAARV
jgi:glycosyltransferase involved in cell wall biosynthesis